MSGKHVGGPPQLDDGCKVLHVVDIQFQEREYAVTGETMKTQCPPTAPLSPLMSGASAHPGCNMGEILHQFRDQVEGGSATFVAVHMSAYGPRLPTRHAPVHGSYLTNTGKVILALSISADDPEPTLRSQMKRRSD